MAGTELAVGYVSLVPSGRNFGRQIIREAQSAGSSAGDSATSAFGSRFVSGMARVGRRAGIALGAGIAAAGFFGIRTAANFEQTRIAFEGILGDVDEATRLLGDLRDFAAKTPFEFTGLAESARALLAVGFTSEEIIPTMTTLGNVAATLGVGETEIAGVVRALGQMSGKGKASAEELQQISEQIPGFSAIGAIAEDMGITTAEAFEQMRKGAIPADQAIESILNGMEEFPGASGAMDRQSKTLNGVLSTLKDTLSGIAIDFITPYLPGLSRGVSTFTDWLQNSVVPALESFAGWIGDIVDRWGPGLVSMFEDHLIPTVKGLATDALEAIKSWWDRNGAAISGFFSTFAEVVGTVAQEVGYWIWITLLPALRDFGSWILDNKAVLFAALTAIAAGLVIYAAGAIAAAASTWLALAPLLPFVLLLAALAGAYYLLADRGDGFLDVIIRTGLAVFSVGVLIVGFFRNLWHWADMAFDAIRDVIDAINDLLSVIPELPGGISIGDLFTPAPLKPLVPWADDGGVWPGPKGVHSLGWVAGGETVLPTHKAGLASFTGGSLIGGDFAPVVVQQPGEDPVSTAMRELNRVLVLMG